MNTASVHCHVRSLNACCAVLTVLAVMLCTGAPVRADTIGVVNKGDSLAVLAARYLPYTDAYTKAELIEAIRRLNGMESGEPSIGSTIVIPVTRVQPVKASTVRKPKTFVARGLYVNGTNAGTPNVFTVAQKLKACGANTIVFDAREVDGVPVYTSRVPHAFVRIPSYAPAIEEVSKLIDMLHAMDVHVIARICVFRDAFMSSVIEEWRYGTGWVDPANHEVQDYNLTVISELIDLGVDEIQLDYFRYPADGKTGTGVEGKSRCDVLVEYLSRIHTLTSANGVLLSLDIFGIVIWQMDIDVRVLGQDVKKMMPYLDIISPMLYPSHFGKGFSGIANPADEPYFFVSQGVKKLRAITGGKVVIRPWLQSFPLRVTIGYGPDYIRTQIDAAEHAGSTGWLLWSPGNRYQDAFDAMDRPCTSRVR